MMATHSRILAWEILCTGEPSGLTVHGVAKSQTRLATKQQYESVNNNYVYSYLKKIMRKEQNKLKVIIRKKKNNRQEIK